MNATPPVLAAFIPDAGAAAAATASESAHVKSDGGSSFASALKEVGAKAGRKSITPKTGSGESLPSGGNSAPVAPQSAASQPAAPPPVASQPSAPVSTAASAADNDVAKVPAKASRDPSSTAIVIPNVAQSGVNSIGAAASSAALEPGAAFLTVPSQGGVSDPLPVGAAAAAADSPDAGSALQEAPAAASGTDAPVATLGGGKGKISGAGSSPRASFKALLTHPAAAVNASDQSGDGDDTGGVVPSTGISTSSTSSASATAAAAAAASASSIESPSTDTSAAAALAATAGSRTAYSAVAVTATDTGAAALGAAAVAAASLTDASLQVAAASAAATVPTAPATMLEGLPRTDKHASVTLDSSSASGSADAAAGLSQLSSSSGAAPVAATATPTLRVGANVDSANFPQDLSARVSWMVDNNINGAKLQVNPPQLGPIELRILVSGDHAQVWMSTHSALTREALESSTPKLREMLGTQGFSQVSVDVSQRSFQERSSFSQPYEQASTTSRSNAAITATPDVSAATRNSLGVLDAYA